MHLVFKSPTTANKMQQVPRFYRRMGRFSHNVNHNDNRAKWESTRDASWAESWDKNRKRRVKLWDVDDMFWDDRYEALVSADGEDGVVGGWPPCGGVDEHVDRLVGDGEGRLLGEHDVQVDSLEDLLEGVERKTGELALDKVGAVLEDGLQFQMPVTALPTRDQMKHMGAFPRLPVFSALCAGQGDTQGGEHGEPSGLVAHPEQSSEEVDLACDCGDGQQTCSSNDEEGEYCLVGKAVLKDM